MKIGLVTYALQVGGIETLLLGLARNLARSGHEVVFVETLAKGQWSQWFEAEGFQVLRVLAKPWRSRVHHTRRVAETLRGYDALILNDAPVAQAALGLLDESQVAVIVLHLLLRTMLRNAAANFSQVDALVAVSPHVAEGAARYGLPKERIVLIPNGVRVPDNWPKRERNPVERPGFIRVAFVGSLSHEQKGVLHLPGIVDRVRTKGLQIQIDVVGDGPDRRALEERIKPQGLESCFLLHGLLSNDRTKQLLNDADVLLMPSYFEGMPIALLEAMASGVVPVASRLPGCTDYMIQDGISGFLAEAGDESGFAEKVVALAGHRQALMEMSKSAWERARGFFSVEGMGASYETLLRCCMAKRETDGTIARSGRVDTSLLGDLPRMPRGLVRPVRKILRMTGLMRPPEVEPLLFKWDPTLKVSSRAQVTRVAPGHEPQGSS